MSTEHHPLFNEFPELREQIHRLKTEDEDFRRLFDEYHELDRMVYRMDENIEPASDEAMEEAKARRVVLKDALHERLRAAG